MADTMAVSLNIIKARFSQESKIQMEKAIAAITKMAGATDEEKFTYVMQGLMHTELSAAFERLSRDL